MIYFTVVKVRFLKKVDFKLLGRLETNSDYEKRYENQGAYILLLESLVISLY